MKWFFKWVANKCKQATEENEYAEKEYESDRPQLRRPRAGLAISKSSNSNELSSRSTTFNLYNANGGYVIELRNYDNARDEWNNSLHIVPNGEDLGKTIEHIITLEALKK
jgi:hypothetical protein